MHARDVCMRPPAKRRAIAGLLDREIARIDAPVGKNHAWMSCDGWGVRRAGDVVGRIGDCRQRDKPSVAVPARGGLAGPCIMPS